MKIGFSKRNKVHGLAFPDYIRLEGGSPRRFHDNDAKSSGIRTFLLPLFLIALMSVLFLKAVSLQLFDGSYYRTLADNNRTRTVVIRAPRGVIFDRNKEPLVFNAPGFRLIDNDKIKILSGEEALGMIAQGRKDLEIDSLREYPYKEIFAHVLGYTGQISKEELGSPRFSGYRGGDMIGKSGVERQYEEKLKGIDGKQLVEVNSMGKIVRSLGQTDPIPGQNIELTLDAKLQKVAFEVASDIKRGAVVVSTPKGEILAIVSKPSFDPNLFTLGETYTASASGEYKNISGILLDSDGQPLLNRAISGAYPPGSTFKLITAAAGLENKLIDENFQVEDTGILQVGAFSFGNWYFLQHGGKEGMVNIIKAIARSNDIFFYKLAEKIGVEKLSEMAGRFGLGEKTGIDLEGELKGTVPSDEWKRKVIGEQWYLGDTYHYGIGQGYLLTTPLQVNIWTQVIANNGDLYIPHLLKNQKSKIKNKNLINEKTRNLIREGMVESCSTGGVAWPFFEFKVQNSKLKVDGKNFLEVPISSGSADMRQISVACKTGTAQHGGEQTLPHSWITLFAPSFDPQIVVTVLSEESGEGSNVAAPIAKKILEAWFTY